MPRRSRSTLTNLVSPLVSVYTVNSTSGGFSGSGTSGSLPYVILMTNSNANPSAGGFEIKFDPSVFSSPQTITLGATLVLSETSGPLVIEGPGASLVTISGAGATGVFRVNAMVTASISGLTITDGTAFAGGGIYNRGSLAISDCTITNNQATGGGNSSYEGGGGIFNDGTLTISGSTITNNQATKTLIEAGGGIKNDGTLTISNSTITDNQAQYAMVGGSTTTES